MRSQYFAVKASDSDTRSGRIAGPGLAKWFRVKPLGLVGFGLLIASFSMAASAIPTKAVARVSEVF